MKSWVLALALSVSAMSAAHAGDAFVTPFERLQKLSSHRRQLWVVGYATPSLADAVADLQASFDNGADAVVFESGSADVLDKVLTEARKRYPNAVLGANVLSNDKTSAAQGFALARKHKLQIVWTDFSGVDLIKEVPEFSLHEIAAAQPPGVFYVSGIHMKYSTLLDSNKTIEKSAQQAMGWVDGVVVTGVATGQATDPERARRARSVMGSYPLGAASGVSAENVGSILRYIDFALVNTSISTPDHRIIGDKVRALRAAMDKE